MTLTCVSWSEGHHDLHFMVQWFCLISWRLFDGWTFNFWIMSQCDTTFDLKSHSDLYFMVQWFCLISWRLSVWCDLWPHNKYGSQGPIFHGPVFFFSVSWRVFHGWMSYFGIMSQCNVIDRIINVVTVTYISWSYDFAVYLEVHLIVECHTLG